MESLINVAILFGGDSYERDISFYTARNIANNLDEKKYNIYLIDIRSNGWMLYVGSVKDFVVDEYFKSMEKIYFSPNNDKRVLIHNSTFIKVDLCFIAVHGKNGEDGRLQGLLDICNIPYIGSGVIGSANCYDKKIFKTILNFEGIPQVKWVSISISEEQDLNNIEAEIPYPVIVKPSCGGSSLGVSIANNREELYSSINLSFKYDNEIIIEEFKMVEEVDCAMFVGDVVETLTLSLNKYSESFYDYHAKYESKRTHVVIPAPINKDTENQIKSLSAQIVRVFNLQGIIRIDFFLTSDNIFVNEVNTQPGIGKDGDKNIWKFNGTLSNLLEKGINRCLRI